MHSIRKTRVTGDHSCPLPPRGGRGQGQPTEEGSKVAALRRGNYPLVSQAAESGHLGCSGPLRNAEDALAWETESCVVRAVAPLSAREIY